MKKCKVLYGNLGFTIIELMIVVAIIGVIASFAIPIYNDFIARGKVSEAMTLLAGTKNTTIEFFGDRGYWPPSVKSVGGKTGGTYTTNIITGGSNPKFFVEVTMTGNPHDVGGKSLRLYWDANTITWWCSTEGTANPIPTKYLPAPCRE